MHGLAAPALAPALALISAPSYLTLAVIGAIAVIVHETRRLLGGLSWTPPSSEFRRAARRAPRLPVTRAPYTVRAPVAHCQSAPEDEPPAPGGLASPRSPRVVVASGKPARRTLAPPPRRSERGSTATGWHVAGALAIAACVMGLALLLIGSLRRSLRDASDGSRAR